MLGFLLHHHLHRRLPYLRRIPGSRITDSDFDRRASFNPTREQRELRELRPERAAEAGWAAWVGGIRRRDGGANVAREGVARAFSGSLCTAPPKPWPRNPGSCSRSAVRDGAKAAGARRGRAARCEPAVALEVGEDLADGTRREQEGDDVHVAAALRPRQGVHFIDPADAGCPGPAQVPAFGCVGLGIGTEPMSTGAVGGCEEPRIVGRWRRWPPLWRWRVFLRTASSPPGWGERAGGRRR